MMERRLVADCAESVVSWLAPACERIELAGSIRRERSEVNDIELVCVPKRDPFDRLSLILIQLDDLALLTAGPKSKGQDKVPHGPRYYRLQTHPRAFRDTPPIQVDVFAVLRPAEWGVIYTIRTGSKDFSKWMVTEALNRGFQVRDGQLFKIHKNEQPWRFEKIPCPEERGFFTALGLSWVEPRDREQPPLLGSRTVQPNQSINQS